MSDHEENGGEGEQPIDPELFARARLFLAARAEAEPKSDGPILPRLNVPGGEISISDAAERLFSIIAPSKQLFYRGGAVVELLRENNALEIKVLDAVSAQSRFEKYVNFYKSPTFEAPHKRTTISEATAKQFLKSEAARERLFKLNGILQTPILIEKNGQLHRVERGYDETTGYFVAGERGVQTVGLNDAVFFLTGILQDFDFVTPGDRSRAIASLITPALKLGGFIKGSIPVDVAEANASQSGKTYRQKMIGAMYNQTLAVVAKKSGGVGSMDEAFSEHLVKGRPFIQLDNVRGKLDSQFLESFLTSDANITARVPYQPNISIDPSKFVIFISSNGFEATKDLTNRASIIRIRKREGYQYTSMNGMDMLELIRAEWQPMLMGCVFAVIEEWFKQGKPKTSETRHDFREWCQVLDWIVLNIFKEAPLMDGHQEAKERAANPELTFLRALAIKLTERQRLANPLSASDLAELAVEEDIEMPGLSPEKQTVEDGKKQIGKIMAKHFQEKERLVFDEFWITRNERWEKNASGNDQKMSRYTFNLTPANRTAGH